MEKNLSIKLIVNTREKAWHKDSISYQEAVVLAFGVFDNDKNVVYTITFSNGDASKPEGSMVKDDIVATKDGMIFNVTQTNKS